VDSDRIFIDKLDAYIVDSISIWWEYKWLSIYVKI
jgi:hypothetical protein